MHNPLRSEAEMFRLVLVIGVAALPIIVLGLAIGPEWGAIALGVEVVLLLGFFWLQSRGSLPRQAEVSRRSDGVHRILVVANETVAGRKLLDELSGRGEGRKAEIFVVVPALTSSRLQHLAHDVDEAIAQARERLERSLEAMKAAGLEARGQVGDHHDPNTAIEDALREFPADEVIVSTHPPERSKWLEGGVLDRAREEVPLPVTHVVVDLEAETAAAPK